jgi:alkane 1-monooxygenase
MSPGDFVRGRHAGQAPDVAADAALPGYGLLPRLPSGYPGMFVLAAIPPLWFRVMDPRALAWAGGDVTKPTTRTNRRVG